MFCRVYLNNWVVNVYPKILVPDHFFGVAARVTSPFRDKLVVDLLKF